MEIKEGVKEILESLSPNERKVLPFLEDRVLEKIFNL